jgi:endoglucanase
MIGGLPQAGVCGVTRGAAAMMRTVVLIVIALVLGLGPGCGPEPSAARLERVLTASWQSYCRHFIKADGQVVIPEEGGGTISEAQAYAMLRAVWANDAGVFNRVYGWTYRNLSRAATHGDHLLAWRWGPKPDGAWGVLDANSAADANLDYALALILAERKGWQAPPGLPAYPEEVRAVLGDILAKEVVALPDGALILTPGNWHEPAPPYLVNPSYFSPAAYRLFAPVSAGGNESSRPDVGAVREPPLQPDLPVTHNRARWVALHQSAYGMLAELNRGLGGQAGVGLFPDWCRVDAAGRLSPAPGKDTRFGWEAVRVPFRVALDRLWFHEDRAAALLQEKFLPFFKGQWQAGGRLFAVYAYDGAPAVDYESPVLYAGVLAGALGAGDREFAREMAQKILSFYREDGDAAWFEAPDHYYANNWAWLGLALYAGWATPGAGP